MKNLKGLIKEVEEIISIDRNSSDLVLRGMEEVVEAVDEFFKVTENA